MPLNASISPSTTPRTAPCTVQATSGSLVVQLGTCAAALEAVSANSTRARTFLKRMICRILSVLFDDETSNGRARSARTNARGLRCDDMYAILARLFCKRIRAYLDMNGARL